MDNPNFQVARSFALGRPASSHRSRFTYPSNGVFVVHYEIVLTANADLVLELQLSC
jgi:hypothetical protein